LTRALILFTIESGLEDQVLADVKKVAGVEEAYVSYGVYDVVVKIKAESMNALKDVITNRLRKIQNVRATLTLILIED
jgi:DNA-binding Lrp family transcriptional regulator